jgi:hypothetical protein
MHLESRRSQTLHRQPPPSRRERQIVARGLASRYQITRTTSGEALRPWTVSGLGPGREDDAGRSDLPPP